MKTPVYLDHHATTPPDQRVLERMRRAQVDHFGNPASAGHAFGWAAARLVEEAREQVAAAIGAEAREIIFTSGATEANNLALVGVARSYGRNGRHLISTRLEHDAVRMPLEDLASGDFDLTLVDSTAEGLIRPEDVADAFREDTILVSIIAAQNEIGTLQPLAGIGALCKERGVLLHSDAAQALGRIPLDVQTLNVDLMSLSAHKVYGPKGVGALYVRRRNPRVVLQPVVRGGGQEQGLRAGTLNVPGVVGFAEACNIAVADLAEEAARLRNLRDRLLETVESQLEGVRVNGHRTERLPGNLNLSFEGLGRSGLLRAMPTLALSAGSACSSSDGEPSGILQGLGLDEELAGASLRIGLGRSNTLEEVDYAAGVIIEAVKKLRAGNAGSRPSATSNPEEN